MSNKTDVTYNEQLGYLATVFHHHFDYLSRLSQFKPVDGGAEFEVTTARRRTAVVRITFVAESAFRFQLYPGARPAVSNTVIEPEALRAVQLLDKDDHVELACGGLKLKFDKYPWCMSVFYQGRLLTREQIADSNVDNMCKYIPVGFDLDEHDNVLRTYERMNLFSDESFYGFGEKFTAFDKRGQRITCWQTDALSTNSENSYKNIPFFISSRGYGVLLNSYTKSFFDMGATSSVSYSMELEDTYLDYILLAAEDAKGLLGVYTDLTGKTPMIPKWAFGLWMSKCSYRTQEEVEKTAEMLREHHIPSNVIHIDGWMRMKSSGDWIWDNERFPDPKGMIEKLRRLGLRLSLWIFPYIPEGCELYEEARKKGYLVKNTSGNPCLFYPTAEKKNRVGAFDFTNPEMCRWYKGRVKRVVKDGVGAVKTDFSEALPENAVFFNGLSGVQGHNRYTLLYSKTIYEAIKEVKDETGERPLLWTRSGFAGSQNYPAHWGGDSSSSAANLACLLRGGLSIGLSGIAFWAHDIGGFYNTDHEGYEIPPSNEEYLRSAQFGLLSPLSRCHGKTPREPWAFGEETENLFREADRFRYRIAPYLYSTAYQAHLNGVPMIRPLFMEFPDDRTARFIDLEYMLGDSLLIAPVFDQEVLPVYLPAGEWCEIHENRRYRGAQWLEITPKLSYIPVFVRENSAVPMLSADVEYLTEEPFRDLDVLVNLSSRADCTFFDDGAQWKFHAAANGEAVTVSTDAPVKSIHILTASKLGAAQLNGRAAALKTVPGGYEIIV